MAFNIGSFLGGYGEQQAQPLNTPKVQDPSVLESVFMASRPGQRYYQVKQEQQKKSALMDIANNIAQNGGNFNRSDALLKYAQATGDLEPLLGVGNAVPSAIQEDQYFQNLDPQGQQRYLNIKRASQLVNQGNQITVRDPSGQNAEVYPVNLKPEDQASNAAAKAGAQEQARLDAQLATEPQIGAEKIRAENAVNAQTALPQVQDQASSMITDLQSLKTHPGKGMALGATSYVPTIRGTDTADFVSRLEKVKGQSFLQAFNALKGAGAITEKESEAAIKASNRLSQDLSEKDFDDAITEIEGTVAAGLKRAQDKAGKSPAMPDQVPLDSQNAQPTREEILAELARRGVKLP